MRHAGAALAVGLGLGLGLVGCRGGTESPMQLSAADRALVGVWQDEGGTLTTISPNKTAGSVVVSKIVDTDGERFEVLKSGWIEGNYAWSYHVPSTGYVLDITIIEMTGENSATTAWKNSEGLEGTEAIIRLPR